MADLFFFCLLLCTTGDVLGQFQLEPLNTAALQGSDVIFKATVSGLWKVMTWNVGELLILTIMWNGSDIPFSEHFSAKLCSGNDSGCVEFTIHNVTRNDSGLVTCTVQGNYGSRSAQLLVQESGSVHIMGGNVTATQDQQVEFQCVTAAWFPVPTISWSLDGQNANSSLNDTIIVAHGDTFNSTAALKFQAVRNTRVECLATVSALTSPQSSAVYLVVVPKPTDWTVLIAVVVSIGSFALVVLLIIGIVFCCKRRKDKKLSYQDEMRRVRTQSQTSGVRPAGQKQGRVNVGYEVDGQNSITPSEVSDSSFSRTGGSQIFTIPDVIDSNQQTNGYSGASRPMKHRHLTFV
ncbi:immunoglobulin superfamily member 5 [Thalassophryne amazonica]|uniref:immunoglobulin superfamily member 5 n=1 Tax=Thalassophryne amazonica TaxID=390379 RepID=UPI0014709569|nr:immunoglobulin superfamily member 5 [Thalassophryne amazonica]